MKRERISFSVKCVMVIFAFGASLSVFATSLYSQEIVQLSKSYNLKMTADLPAGHHKNWVPSQFVDIIEKRTNGKVKISLYEGTLGKPGDHWEMLKGNAVQLASLANAFNVPQMPILSLLGLPFELRGLRDTDAVFDAWTQAGLLKEITDNFHMLGIFTVENMQFFFAKKKVTSMEELKGMKIRAQQTLYAQTTAALGGTPVSMSAGEVYMAMQTGVIDGAITAIGGFIDRKFGEVCKYALQFPRPVASGGFVMAVNKETWNSFPKELQDLMTEVMGELLPMDLKKEIEIEENGLAFFKKIGVIVYSLSPEEEARWIKAVADVGDKYVSDLKAKGYPAEKAREVLRKVVGD